MRNNCDELSKEELYEADSYEKELLLPGKKHLKRTDEKYVTGMVVQWFSIGLKVLVSFENYIFLLDEKVILCEKKNLTQIKSFYNYFDVSRLLSSRFFLNIFKRFINHSLYSTTIEKQINGTTILE
jgi:hypothetical protein